MRFFNGAKIADLREENNVTLKTLGACAGVTKQAISQYESGKRMPSPMTLVRIADAFGVSLDEFFTTNLSEISKKSGATQKPADTNKTATGG